MSRQFINLKLRKEYPDASVIALRLIETYFKEDFEISSDRYQSELISFNAIKTQQWLSSHPNT